MQSTEAREERMHRIIETATEGLEEEFRRCRCPQALAGGTGRGEVERDVDERQWPAAPAGLLRVPEEAALA